MSRVSALDAFPRRDCLFGSDPQGPERGCANTTGPVPTADPSTGGPCERALRPRPPGITRRKTFARRSFGRPAGAHLRSAAVRTSNPQLVDLNTVLLQGRTPRLVHLHPQRPHDRLQAALSTESVEVVRVPKATVRKKELGVLPVPEVGIAEICGLRHRVAAPSTTITHRMVLRSPPIDRDSPAIDVWCKQTWVNTNEHGSCSTV